jgi:hypothetical protein
MVRNMVDLNIMVEVWFVCPRTQHSVLDGGDLHVGLLPSCFLRQLSTLIYSLVSSFQCPSGLLLPSMRLSDAVYIEMSINSTVTVETRRKSEVHNFCT